MFLDTVGDPSWSWRCAWTPGLVPEWVDRYAGPLGRYRRVSSGEQLPSLARIWGAVRNGKAEVIVDQENLRVWVWDKGAPRELLTPYPAERVCMAIKAVTA